MRIPDEKQLFKIGDEVETLTGLKGIVSSVIASSTYYEARPIASYTSYTYVVIAGDEKLYLQAKLLRVPPH
jgi:hypothetical protein